MKKLLAAALIFAGGTAFAQVDATEVGPAIKKEAKDIGHDAKHNVKDWGRQAGLATEDEGTFKTAGAFNLKGTLKDGGRGEVTVERKGMPDAVLDVRDETAIYVDGKKAKPSDLKAGMDVKAKFQLEGEETVAVRLDGKSKGYGGAGKAGTDAKELKDDAKYKSEKEWNKAEKKMDHAADEAHDAKY